MNGENKNQSVSESSSSVSLCCNSSSTKFPVAIGSTVSSFGYSGGGGDLIRNSSTMGRTVDISGLCVGSAFQQSSINFQTSSSSPGSFVCVGLLGRRPDMTSKIMGASRLCSWKGTFPVNILRLHCQRRKSC